ncbi:asparagine synthase [Brevibacillus gelatini]|uniref:asparagine synthase (glutamine-hydrolyzing) n=1 Tax=Brevibacillus gelatini TaxID=1655277 RepID=A0A3M8B1M6_9BACL|nr:asparagine synthase-related protein [Brevibacillus gelatini]RNB57356.1 asparagine synthase [Brevibacillus gelatini]
MKMWIALHGGSDHAWNNWTRSLSVWLQDTVTAVATYEGGAIKMAEFCYRYQTNSKEPPRKERLRSPFVMDGWLTHPNSGFQRADKLSGPQRAELHSLLSNRPQEMLRASHGDFTVAVWEESSQTLYIGSDGYGTRPIYYWKGPSNELYVSNDLRALLHAEAVPFAIDYERCAMYLSSQYAVGENSFDENTFFQEIKKVPDATLSVWKDNRLAHRSYWGIEDLAQLPMLQTDAVPLFRERLIEVVNERLYHEKTILEVSGGLDSAGVLAAALAGGNRERILGVNISFAGDDMIQSHDRDVVRKLFQDLQLPGIIILGDNTLRIANAELGRDPLWYLDGPDPRANVLVNEMYNALANEFQTDLGLTGEGGDFLFSGEHYVLDSLLRQKKFKAFGQALWEWADKSLSRAVKLGFAYGIAPFLPGLNNYLYYKLAWADTVCEMPDYFTQTHLNRESRSKQEDYQRYAKSQPLKYWGRRYHYDYTWPRASYLDAVGVSMQNMHPFYDRRIMELSFSVPTEQHYDLKRGKVENYYGTKMLIRKAFTDILPPYLYDRVTKTSYAHMARKSLQNEKRNLLQLFDRSGEVQLHTLGVIDKEKFWDHLVGTLIRSTDVNNDLGMSYQFLRAVIDMEIWLQEMSRGRHHVLERAKPCNPRWLADVELIGESRRPQHLAR